MPDPVVVAKTVTPPPEWALRERHLIEAMNRAAPEYQARYTRADGTLVRRESWPGMDGSDDGYESFHNWPLFYALGGSADLHERSRFLWDAVTRQFTAYGQIYREFDGSYDWMHHGESSIYLYYFGLADPAREPDRSRALRFAGMYTGDDREAGNWDAGQRMIRSPINGSRGPRFENSWEDWETHRWVLAEYPVPFEDLDVPLEARKWHDNELVEMADWKDDAVYAAILKALNERQMRCDVPLNLCATSLVTHAYLHTGDERYRRWVLDYLEAWSDRIRANGGVCPDNVGPSGRIGETMGGKWWGGYYGWRWPHGFMTIIEPLTIAAMNATLLSGDQSWLDIPRGQLDALIAKGREKDGRLLVPHRHTDEGWTSFRPLSPHHAAQIWYLSQDQSDRRRLESIPETRTDWLEVRPGRGKGDDIHFGPWYCYLDGRNPDYPRRILEAQAAEVSRRMEAMRADRGDPESWDVHHWQDKNPVHTEGLLQLACGGPQIVYHGGLLHVRLRPFDALERRPGLPEDVAALVSALDGDSVVVELANIGMLRERRVKLLGGAFGEHRFVSVEEIGGASGIRRDAAGGSIEVVLPPSRTIKLRLGMSRFASAPSYRMPL